MQDKDTNTQQKTETTYDFYFSQEMKTFQMASAQEQEKPYNRTLFNGQEFVYRIKSGEKPELPHITDLKLIGSGTESQVTYP